MPEVKRPVKRNSFLTLPPDSNEFGVDLKRLIDYGFRFQRCQEIPSKFHLALCVSKWKNLQRKKIVNRTIFPISQTRKYFHCHKLHLTNLTYIQAVSRLLKYTTPILFAYEFWWRHWIHGEMHQDISNTGHYGRLKKLTKNSWIGNGSKFIRRFHVLGHFC